jgi:hypothetical protein
MNWGIIKYRKIIECGNGKMEWGIGECGRWK